MISKSLSRTALWAGIGIVFAGSLALYLAPAEAQTDAYPDRMVTLITPVPPGGSVDTLARVTADKMEKKWGQTVVVMNRPGASGNIGIGTLARAAPDGYTLMFGPGQHLVCNKILYPNSTDPDLLVPVSRFATNPLVLAINPKKVPVKTLQEFIAYAKAHPGKLNYASAGNGGMPHLAAEMFKTKAGVKMTKVTYKGVAPSMLGVADGEVDLIFVDISTALPFARSGRMRILGVASEKRDPALPNVPALPEVLPGMLAETWFAITAPPKTPAAIVQKISAAAAEIVHLPDVKKKLAFMGNIDAIGSTPKEMADFIRKDRKRWAEVIANLGMNTN